jgi:hypothetical protein
VGKIPDAVLRKLDWAEHQLQVAALEVRRHLDGNPGKIVVQDKSSATDERLSFKAGTIDASVPLAVGDFIQNLRSTLDYLVWELVEARHNKPGINNAFPIKETPDLFGEELKRGRLRGTHADVVTEIERLQPYHFGDEWRDSVLFVIDQLCNLNKHRRILLAKTEAELSNSRARIVGVDGGIRAVDLNAESLGGSIGEKMQVHVKGIVYITLNDGPSEALKQTEIVRAMDCMFGFVATEVLPVFERFF